MKQISVETYFPEASKLLIDGEEITGFVDGVFFKKVSSYEYQFTITPLKSSSFEYLSSKINEYVNVEFIPGLATYDLARDALSVKGLFILCGFDFEVGTSFPTCTFKLVKGKNS